MVEFDYYGNHARIYEAGEIVYGPKVNDILYDPQHDKYYTYLSGWQAFKPDDSKGIFFQALLYGRKKIEMDLGASKLTEEERSEKYDAFEHLLNF